ncbi:hypothetical protein G5B30_15105 [Sphingobacterium sp. SGG-5]|uniref:hypothetical protein n=1 Tax=Sphingobacterium sp. SGG-5 TaxID=2710881 RepID=UPI0013EDAA0D|nr:hypothetical protein [Sphingobacterium sp. SGG-5]NGM63236.1 hypothetical protein [Sphingobacterium sp. SGG-5]
MKKVRHWDLEGWQGNWNGDVWKAIADLALTRDDLRIFTLNMDFGLAIIMKGVPEFKPKFTLEDIRSGDYAFFDRNREKLINLREPKYFKQVFFAETAKK